MRRKSSFALLCGALVLLLASAERQFVYGQAAPPTTPAPPATTPSLTPLEIDLEGLRKIVERDSTQPRPLLLNFWATWCDPCREEFPDLLKIKSEYEKLGLDFAAISFDFSEDVQEAVPEFLREMKADIKPYWLNIPDPTPAVKYVDVEWTGGIPVTFLFDAQGKIAYKKVGRFKPAELRLAIDKALNIRKKSAFEFPYSRKNSRGLGVQHFAGSLRWKCFRV